ncbi:hypothetical protein, partial [Pseudomonas sp. GW704-F5]|uniref:hypothetical protein n=1 Tax=Pseudomonas sp. GW704-F5 TaxID=2070576 RepID=UPI001A92C83F
TQLQQGVIGAFQIPGHQARNVLSLLAKALCIGAYTSILRHKHKDFQVLCRASIKKTYTFTLFFAPCSRESIRKNGAIHSSEFLSSRVILSQFLGAIIQLKYGHTIRKI